MARARASNRAARRLLLALLLPAMTACASDFDRKLEEAEQLRMAAAEAGVEWLNTASLLQQARDAAAAGDEALALTYVEQARLEAAAALQQAENEAETWQHRVIR
jgi:hypothetical protein